MVDAFHRNFAERGEVGAACVIYKDNRKVVDLWGGYRDGRSRSPWQEDTLVTVFSSTKGVSGLAIALAIAAPLDIEFYIGVPDSLDQDRIAFIHGFKPAEMMLHVGAMPWRFVLGFLNPRSISARAFTNPKVLGVTGNYNLPEVRRPELPAANGTGQVRAIARAYGDAATGGTTLGLKQSTLDALVQPAARRAAASRTWS